MMRLFFKSESRKEDFRFSSVYLTNAEFGRVAPAAKEAVNEPELKSSSAY